MRNLSPNMETHGSGCYAMNTLLQKCFLCILIALCILLGSSRTAYAKTMVSDSAGLLSTEEVSNIEDTCDLILQQYDTSVFIITTNTLGKSDNYKKYLKEQSKKVDSSDNLVILFVSVKKKENVCQINCYGKKVTAALTENRRKKMMHSVEKQIKNEKYYEGIERFCDDVSQSLTIKPTLDGFIFQSIPQLIFSILLGCGVVFYLLYPGKKRQATLYTYLNKKDAKNIGHLDYFSHKEVVVLKAKKKDKAENTTKEIEE